MTGNPRILAGTPDLCPPRRLVGRPALHPHLPDHEALASRPGRRIETIVELAAVVVGVAAIVWGAEAFAEHLSVASVRLGVSAFALAVRVGRERGFVAAYPVVVAAVLTR